MRALLLLAATLTAAPAPAQTTTPTVPRLMRPDAPPTTPVAEPTEIVTYGDAPSQAIDVYTPDPGRFGAGPHPVVALIHGGCFGASVAKRENFRNAATDLANRGYAVWSIGYRRIDEEGGGYPGTHQDVAAALDKLAAEAKDRNFDLRRYVLVGHSAGGTLALWSTTRAKLAGPLAAPQAAQPKAVIALGAPGDLKNWDTLVDFNCGPGTLAKLVGEKTDARPDPYADTSPFESLPTGVPVVLVHGVYDGVAFPELGRAYAFRAQARGDKAQIVVIPNAGHFEVSNPGTPAWATVLNILAERIAAPEARK